MRPEPRPSDHEPEDASQSAPPQSGIRGAVLLEIKRLGVATATTLIKSLHCSANAVRYQLKELEREGAVTHELVRQGVGAPAHAYRLSAKGRALFPDRCASTLSLLLDEIVALRGRDASAALLQAHFAALGERVCREVAQVPSQVRAERIAAVLDDEGFMASWQPTADGGVLTEHNCPHQVVAERFPEVCAAEETFLAQAFGARVERESRIAGGCGCCRYHITPNATAGEQAG